VGRDVVRLGSSERRHGLLAEATDDRQRSHEDGQLLDKPSGIVSYHDHNLESSPFYLAVEQQHRVDSFAQAESVDRPAEDRVNGFEQVRDSITAGDRMDEDRTVEDDVGGEEAGESLGSRVRAAHLFERVPVQANPSSSIESRGYSAEAADTDGWRPLSLIGRDRDRIDEIETSSITATGI
jgi:hypothetical protein